VCGLNRLMSEVRDANLAVLEKRTLADLAVNPDDPVRIDS